VLQPPAAVDLAQRHADEAPTEITRLQDALARARGHLEKLQTQAHGPLVDILAAQREMLDDPELKQRCKILLAAVPQRPRLSA
jgi:phosphoenolpyruvate-protein kinase (PTS system EI component)